MNADRAPQLKAIRYAAQTCSSEKSMETDGDLLHVIDRAALIENVLNQIIEAFCEPRQERSMFLWDVILDSSIMPMGSKVKVVAAIAQEMNVKLDQKAIHSVMALRNAFAHHPLDSHPVLIVGKTPAEDESHFQLQILSNSGKLSRKRRKDALDEFNSSYQLAKASLVGLRDTVKTSHSTSGA